MIIVLKKGVSEQEIEAVKAAIIAAGLQPHVSKGTERTIIGAIGDERKLNADRIASLPGVEKVMPILKPYKLASREFHPENTVIDVDGVKIGGREVIMIAGPCAIESEEQLFTTAEAVKKSGAKILRASAYKPRTSPYDFQGMGEKGLTLLKKAKKELGMVVETEVMDTRQVELVAKHVDILRVGARNMQNFDLLKEGGKVNKPVILKNGIASTMKEFLMAAEYIMSEGNQQVILCNRGVRTFEQEFRFPLNVGLVPLLKKESHLPVIVDPTHSMGRPDLIPPISKASVAAGADGWIVEVHCDPKSALCDGPQAMTPALFDQMMKELRPVARAVGREMP